MRPCQQVETFPDGVVEVYEETNRKLGKLKATLRFEEQSVGINRYYQAQASVSSNRIDRVIKVPHTKLVDRLNIAFVKTEDDKQYRIQRIQEKPERGVDLWELQSVAVAIRRE
jgi:SPP1 family predicted phage head-tail adaptor